MTDFRLWEPVLGMKFDIGFFQQKKTCFVFKKIVVFETFSKKKRKFVRRIKTRVFCRKKKNLRFLCSFSTNKKRFVFVDEKQNSKSKILNSGVQTPEAKKSETSRPFPEHFREMSGIFAWKCPATVR